MKWGECAMRYKTRLKRLVARYTAWRDCCPLAVWQYHAPYVANTRRAESAQRAKEKPADHGGPCWVLSSFCKVCQYEDGQQDYCEYPDHAVTSFPIMFPIVLPLLLLPALVRYAILLAVAGVGTGGGLSVSMRVGYKGPVVVVALVHDADRFAVAGKPVQVAGDVL